MLDEVSPATAPVQVSCKCRDATAFQSFSFAVLMVSLANQAYTTAKLSRTRGAGAQFGLHKAPPMTEGVSQSGVQLVSVLVIYFSFGHDSKLKTYFSRPCTKKVNRNDKLSNNQLGWTKPRFRERCGRYILGDIPFKSLWLALYKSQCSWILK